MLVKKSLISFIIFFATLVSMVGLLNNVVSAAEGGTECGNRTFLGIPAWDKYLVHTEIEGRCSPVINGAEGILPIGIAILEAAIRLGGLVAVVMVLVGAFRFITSQGNPENAAAARKTIINSLIGLVIVIIATSVVAFLGNRLATPPDSSSREASTVAVVNKHLES